MGDHFNINKENDNSKKLSLSLTRHSGRPEVFCKKDALREIREISKNTFSYRTPPMVASKTK